MLLLRIEIEFFYQNVEEKNITHTLEKRSSFMIIFVTNETTFQPKIKVIFLFILIRYL